MVVENRKRKVSTFLLCLFVFTWAKLCLIQNSDGFHQSSTTPQPSRPLGQLQEANPLVKVSSSNFEKTCFNDTPPTPGVILFVKGGIGNQLWEYACAYGLARSYNLTNIYNFVVTNSSKFNLTTRKFSAGQRDYALDKFHIPLDNFITIDRTTRISANEVTYFDDEKLFFRSFPQTRYYQLSNTAYCQSPEYWWRYGNELKSAFRMKEEAVGLTARIRQLATVIYNTESVALHVRRGDFLNNPGFRLPISYQRSAIHRLTEILRQQGKWPTFFVFSDDISYARQTFEELATTFGYKFIYVSDPNITSVQDFYLMRKCKHFIIPNSTFAWWAAYLGENPGKIVIASTFNSRFWGLWKRNHRELAFYRMLHGQKYHPKEWIVMNPFVGDTDGLS